MMKRGEIWFVELGLAEKPRPVLILSVDYMDNERAIVTYVPRTTSVRGTRFEITHGDRRFKPGAFDAQGIGTVPTSKVTRHLATLDHETLSKVEDAVRLWLGL
jgi:mRNA interferase MazF